MIDRLELLLALARERHFGRAAIACGTTQPSFSAAIKHLEASFGTQLVERGSRFHGFTPAGERVLDWARRIVGDARAMREEVAGLRHTLTGPLRLAAIPTAMPMLARLTVPFAERHPAVAITILSRNAVEVQAMLENLEVDAGITYLDPPQRRTVAVPLFIERLRFVCAATDPLAGRASLAWAELDGLRLCLLTPDMQNRRIIDAALACAGAAPLITLESDSMLALLAHLRSGRWASVLPEHWLDTLGLGAGLRTMPLDAPALSANIGLIAPQREPMTALTAALLAQAALFDRLS